MPKYNLKIKIKLYSIRYTLYAFLMLYAISYLPCAVSCAEEISSSNIIRGIEFKGNYHFPSAELFKKIPLSSRYGDYLDKKKIEDDLKSIYRLGVFSDVFATFEKSQLGTKIIFSVRENPPLKDIEFIGLEAFSAERLIEKLELKRGLILDYNLLEKDLKRIGQFYQEKGYEYSGISNIVFDLKSRELLITINEIKVEEIKILGNTRTKDYIILREIATKPGSLLNLKKLVSDRERIFALGLFNEVKTPYISEGTKPNLAKVIIEVDEAKFSSINGGFGYSQIDNWIGYGSLLLGNLGGRAESFYIKGQLSQKRNTYEIRYVRPWTFFDRVSFSLDKWFIIRDENYTSVTASGTQSVEKEGLSMTLTRPLTDLLSTSFRLESENVIPSVTDAYLKRSAKFLIAYDSRDNFLDAKKGTYTGLSLEQAFKFLGSSIEFGRYDFDYYYFTPFRDRVTIAFRFTAGMLKPQAESSVYIPISENYQVGGASTVRGYPDTVPFAVGQRQIIGSLEYRQSLSPLIGVVGFFDWGSAFDGRIDISSIKIGKGIGLRINTPMGPIRGDFGWGEAGLMVFHFSLGQAF